MNNGNDIAISIENVSKEYRLGAIGHGTLYRDLQSWWAKKVNRPDPNSMIYGKSSDNEKSNASYFWALKNINLKIYRGDIIGIIGKNGAGKSTLLKILSRITSPSSGEIQIHGRVSSLLEVGTGFHAELTGRENVYLNGAILGMTKKEIDNNFDEIVAFSELEKFIDTPVKRYSSGMTVRLAFAVAAHLNSDILIIDEVLAVGDIAFKNKCLSKINGISKNNEKTILFVSHDIATILNLCKSTIVMENGKVVFEGGTREGVAFYLRQNEPSKEKSLEWLPSKNKSFPFHQIIKILGYKLISHDDRVISGTVMQSDRCKVRIDFELLVPDSRIIFQLHFFTADNTCLFVTDIFDIGEENDLGKIKPGVGKFFVNVPDFLMSGDYSLELLCALHHTGWVLSPNNESRIPFQYSRDSDKNPYARDDRKGIIAPIMEWNIKHD